MSELPYLPDEVAADATRAAERLAESVYPHLSGDSATADPMTALWLVHGALGRISEDDGQHEGDRAARWRSVANNLRAAADHAERLANGFGQADAPAAVEWSENNTAIANTDGWQADVRGGTWSLEFDRMGWSLYGPDRTEYPVPGRTVSMRPEDAMRAAAAVIAEASRADRVVVALLNTGSYRWLAIGSDRDSAAAALYAAWDRYVANAGGDPDFLTRDPLEDGLWFYEGAPGAVWQDDYRHS
jgi:hypothetical protein